MSPIRSRTSALGVKLAAGATAAVTAAALLATAGAASAQVYPPGPGAGNGGGNGGGGAVPAQPNPGAPADPAQPTSGAPADPAQPNTGAPAQPAQPAPPAQGGGGGPTEPNDLAQPGVPAPPPQRDADEPAVARPGVGRSFTLSGPTNQPVQLLAATVVPGSGRSAAALTPFRVVRQAVIGESGTITFVVVPGKNTVLKSRFIDAEGNVIPGTESAETLVRVASGGSIGARRVATRTLTFSGKLLPAASGVRVQLWGYSYRSVGGKLVRSSRPVQYAAGTTNGFGVYSIQRRFGTGGRFDFFVVIPKTGSNEAGSSNTRPTIVR